MVKDKTGEQPSPAPAVEVPKARFEHFAKESDTEHCNGRIIVKLIQNHGKGGVTVIFKCGSDEKEFKEEFKIPSEFKHRDGCMCGSEKSRIKFAPVLETVYNGQLWRCCHIVDNPEEQSFIWNGMEVRAKKDIGCSAVLLISEGGIPA